MATGLPIAGLAGRRVELAALETLLDDVAGGIGRVALLVGEPGIGKTRTAAEFASRARTAGARLGWGTCFEGEWVPPLGPWVQAIGELVADADPAALGANGPVLARVLPALRMAFPDAAPTLSAEEERYRLYEALTGLLAGLCSSAPVVLVLDDLHWADAGSLRLLEYVARQFEGMQLLVVGTYRDVRPELTTTLTACLAELARLRRVERLPLAGLTVDDTTYLLETLLNRPVPAAVAASLHAETGGQPFFIEEVVRNLCERGGELEDALERAPESVRETLSVRLARVSPETARLLGVACAFTGGFDFSTLRALTGLSDDVLLDCLDEALGARMVRSLGGEEYDFVHAIVRHTLYEGLSASRQARMHRRIAAVLEQVHAGREAEHAAELASQYHASVTLPGASHGVKFALAAAEQAASLYDAERAVTFLRIGRDLARDSAKLYTNVLCRLAVAEAEALLVDEATGTVEAALPALDRERRATFLAAVGWALRDAGASRELIDSLRERGLAAAGDRHDLTWARLKLLELPVEPIDAGEIRAGLWLGFEPTAVRIMQESGNELDYARTLEPMDWRSRDELDALLALASRWQYAPARIHALTVIMRTLCIQHGALDEAAELCAQLVEDSRRIGSIPGEAYGLEYLLEIDVELGRAAPHHDELGALLGRLGPDHRLADAIAVEGRHFAGNWTAAADMSWANAQRVFPWIGLVHAAMAAARYALAGEAVRARQILDLLLPGCLATPPRAINQNGAVCNAAGAAWTLQAAALATPLRDKALELVDAGVGDFWQESNELAVARMTALLGETDAALEWFERARQTAERTGRRPLQAISDLDEAIARVRLRRTGAGALLASARRQFTELGMEAWLERARQIGSSLDRAERHELPGGLTAREAEVLRLVARGASNKEIAAELVLSVHTVERHLANAYRKIGARNRAEATGFALEHRL